MANPLKPERKGNALGATDPTPRPGDFPLGSVESRAAARAMLERERALSPYDQDCLWVYYAVGLMDARVFPSSQEIVHTDVYKRGREIHDQQYGPILPAHLDPKLKRQTSASIEFEAIHGREPVPGDILRYEDVEEFHAAESYEQLLQVMREAWERRLPELPFPFKVEDGRFYKQSSDGKGRIFWIEEEDRQPGAIWMQIEAEAFGPSDGPRQPNSPVIQAVVFVESEDGKHRTKPLRTGRGSGASHS